LQSGERIEEDRLILRALAIAIVALAVMPAAAGAATVSFNAGSGVIRIVDDVAAADDITVEETSTLHVITNPGPGGLDSPDGSCTEMGAQLNCPRGSSIAVDLGEGDDRFRASDVTVPITVAGGPGNDDLQTGRGRDVLAGGAGNDKLNGGPSIDEFFGETGDDTIEARDGHPERISCGAGTDEAHNDFIDIIAECERGIDADHDGFSSAIDCNDNAANIFPAAP
jgi:Ca2+-binding RTX toxin-like protein